MLEVGVRPGAAFSVKHDRYPQTDVWRVAARQAEESMAYNDMSVPARPPMSTVCSSIPAFEVG